VIVPGPQGSSFAPQDVPSFVGVARFRQDFGGSYAGALATARELDGGGYNRVFGPDLQWRATSKDRITGQLLWSESLTPQRPDLAPEWNGQKLSGHAAALTWNHQQRGPNWSLEYRDVADGFRADTGFVPRVGYRQGRAVAGWGFYPEALVSQLQPNVTVAYSEDRDGRVLQRLVEPALFLLGQRNLQAFVALDVASELTGDTLLDTTSVAFQLQVDPSRSVTRLGLQGSAGESIDLANAQVGTGADLTAYATLRPHARLTLDLVLARRWLDVPVPSGERQRLFTADVARVKAVAHVSPRAYLRVIAQWVGTRSDPSLHPYPVPEREGGFEGSALFSYRLNWQTALFVGYGDERALDERQELRPASRQLFAKLSYAFQL
jgi:hypothetical protein